MAVSTTTTTTLTDKQVLLLLAIITLLVEINAQLRILAEVERALDKDLTRATFQLFAFGRVFEGTEENISFERNTLRTAKKQLRALRTALRFTVGALEATM